MSGPSARTLATGVGALALLVRPTYIATEYVVKLGEVGCSPAHRSPRHEVMNGSFMGFGALMAGGALLLARRLGSRTAGLLVVSGVSSFATGLAL